MATVSTECLIWIQEALHTTLELSEEAETYLRGRGFTTAILEALKIRTWECPSRPCPDHVWTSKYGACGEIFEGKVAYPFWSPQGTLVGVEFRSPYQKDVFKVVGVRSKWIPLWGGMPLMMSKIWKTKSVVLVEGVFDAAPLWRAFPEAPILSCGTANVSRTQFAFLERLVEDVYVVFDNDPAGRKGCSHLERKARSHFRVHPMWEYGRLKDDPGAIWDRGGEDLVHEVFYSLGILFPRAA